jgi:Transposase DDE domain
LADRDRAGRCRPVLHPPAPVQYTYLRLSNTLPEDSDQANLGLQACAACLLRQRCITSRHGRSVSVHPDEALLAELRERQATPAGRAMLRERVKVEHALAHVGHWQGRRARYRRTRKNLFDLRRVALVHNLHVIQNLFHDLGITPTTAAA